MKPLAVAAIAAALACGGCAGPSAQQLRDRGTAQFEQGRTEEALASFSRLLDVSPADPDGLYYMGCVYHRQGRLAQAIAYYRACLDAAPWRQDCQAALDRAQRQSGIHGQPTRFVP